MFKSFRLNITFRILLLISLVLALVGTATTRAELVLAGAVVACPFLFYLFLTPRLRWVAPPVAALLFLAAPAAARRMRRTALLLIVPYAGLAVFVAYLALNSAG